MPIFKTGKKEDPVSRQISLTSVRLRSKSLQVISKYTKEGD